MEFLAAYPPDLTDAEMQELPAWHGYLMTDSAVAYELLPVANQTNPVVSGALAETVKRV
jgi:hypothetical protein